MPFGRIVLIFIIVINCGLIFLLTIGYFLARYIKILRKFYCHIGWHCPREEYKHLNLIDTQCSWCGYVGLVDSQGNLF